MKLSSTLLFLAAALPQALALKNDFFYTTAPADAAIASAGYTLAGVAAWVPTIGLAGAVTVYEFYQPTVGFYFYTTDPAGESAPENGYTAQGPAYAVWNIGAAPPSQSVPWYRFVQSNGNHFYTTDNALGASLGFTLEGVVGYVFSGAVGDDVPLYRWDK